MAEEIQTDRKWEYGDWLVSEYGIFQIGTASFKYSKDPTLPRQDQLQEMIDDGIADYIKAVRFRKFLKDHAGLCGQSMECLWLHYVMKEKYCKIWNGKEWVKS